LLEQLTRLMSLQTFDRRLRELEESLATINAGVVQLREEAVKAETELERLSEEDRQALLLRKQTELELAEGEAHIRNHRMRLNLIRNDKELQATNHEIDTLKESNQRLESEVLMQMEAAEQRAPRIKELGESVQKTRTELIAAEKKIAAQVEEIKEALAKHRSGRDAMAHGIDEGLRLRYEVIFNKRNGTAVVAVKGGTCQGCRRSIPPQLHNLIQRHEQIHFCPNCQRILYIEPADPGTPA
jgi:uncharacterized protein